MNEDGKGIDNPTYIKVPNWSYRYDYDEDENVTAVAYLSHYSIVKGGVYQITIESGQTASMMNSSTSYSISETYYTDLTNETNTVVYVDGGELKNDDVAPKTYYVLAKTYDPNFDFSSYTLSATVIPVVSETLELKATITENKVLTAVNTSTDMYKAVSNMKDYDIRYYKGYGNLYKVTVPGESAVTISSDDTAWNGFIYSSGNMEKYADSSLYQQTGTSNNGTNTIVNLSNTDKEYYLWIAYAEAKSYDVEFTYADVLVSKYENAHDLTNNEEISITDATSQDNYVENYYCVGTMSKGLLYHFPEGPAVITVELNDNSQLDILDAYGNTGYINSASYRGAGTHTIYTTNYNCRGNEGWVLLSADSKEDLNGCIIKYEEQKTFTELNQTNVLTLNQEYICSLANDKTLEINGVEYYGYSFDISSYDTVDFNVISSTAQNDYSNISFANDYGGNLMASSFSSNEAQVSILQSDLSGMGNNVILLIPKTYQQYGYDSNGMWRPIDYTSKIDDIKIKVTLPPTLDDYKDQAIELTDGTVYTQAKTSDYTYIMDRSALFKTEVPKGYSATLRVRNQAFYKNVAVHDDLRANPIVMDEHVGYTSILLDIPANDEEDKLYYIDLYYRLYQYSDTQVEIILKDEWRRNNKFDKYAAGVNPGDMTIDLSQLEKDGLNIDNIKNVTNGTFDKASKTIVVEDITKVVDYDYFLYDHYVDMKLVPYEKSDSAVLVSEGQTIDSNGNTVENMIEVSAQGELSAVVTETTMNSAVSDDATLKLRETKDLSEESTNGAAVTLEQNEISNDDIQKTIEFAEEKNETYSQNSQSANIGEITTSFTEETNSSISSDIFDLIQEDTDSSKKGFDIIIAKKDNEGNDEYIWSFKGSEITDTTKSLNPDMDVQEEGYNEQIKDLVEEDKEITVLNFKNSGVLPGAAEVKIYVADQYEDGQIVTCSYFDEANNCLSEAQDVMVVDGYVTITITHCSDYVLEATKTTQHEHSVVVDKAVDSTCTETGLTEGSHCSECNTVIKAQAVIEKLPHTYNQKIVSGKTMKSEATSESSAIYYYSCSCGAIGTDTFSWGEPLVGSDDTAGSDTTQQPDVTPEPTPEPSPKPTTKSVDIKYHTHIEAYGDSQGVKKNGEMAGTSGESKRLESIWLDIDGNDELGIQYTTHCEGYGWMPWATNGEISGTSGESKRLEAIMIRLTGDDANKYDVYYRVHAESYGWLGWAKNGEVSGTSGKSKRLEGIQVVVVPAGEAINEKMGGFESRKTESYINGGGVSPVLGQVSTNASNPIISGAETPYVMYKTHVESYGWQKWVLNGSMSGTSGKSKRLEGINIKLSNAPYKGDIVYTTHVESYGWQGQLDNQKTWKKNGEMSGTSGQSKRLEAICINLTGEMAEHYDVYYRVHAESYGWLNWAKNGEKAGTAGHSKRLEGIQVILVPKGGEAPSVNYGKITSDVDQAFIQK